VTWRTAHGRARACGRLVVSETRPADELPPGRGSTPGRPERDSLGRFLPGNRAARRQLGRVHPAGALALLDARADPAWRSARRWGQRAGMHRIAEVARAHGGELSSGACRLLRSAARMAADAEYLSRRAAAEDLPDLLRTAAQLDAGARQAERDAWELASREAQARRASTPAAVPWLLPDPPVPSRAAEHSHGRQAAGGVASPSEGATGDETSATGRGACSTVGGGGES